MAELVYQNFGDIDVKQALKNLAYNELIDQAVGRGNRKAGEFYRREGFDRGLTSGPTL